MLIAEVNDQMRNCLHIACLYGHWEIVKVLLHEEATKALLKTKDLTGYTPL